MGTSNLLPKLLLTMSTLITPFLLLLAMLVYNQASPLPGETCTTTKTCKNGNCTWGCQPRRKREDVDVDPLLVKTKREDDDSLSLKEQKDDNDDDDQYEDMNEGYQGYDQYGNPSCEWNDSAKLCL